jgi:hypothetical protein
LARSEKQNQEKLNQREEKGKKNQEFRENLDVQDSRSSRQMKLMPDKNFTLED